LPIALRPRALLEQGEKASQLAPDATLIEADDHVRLVIGPLEAAPGRARLLPGLMRLRTIDIEQAGGAENVERARRLFSAMDLAPLRALLANPPKLPASRKAAEGEAAKGQRAAAEAEVYRAVLDLQGGEQAVVMAETSKITLGKGFKRIAKAAMPDLLPSALEDFYRVAASSAPFPEVAWSRPVVLLTAKESKKIFDSESRDGWKVFRAKHPGAHSILTLSRVGLSRDRSQAVVSVAWWVGWLAGAGEIWFMKRTKNGWRMAYKILCWVN
jgi:hypothetical protein